MKKINLTGKSVLIIGSGEDLNGRGMGRKIDAGVVADVIIRVNKPYGNPKDVGSKIDIAFFRKRAFQFYYFPAYVHDLIETIITEERDIEDAWHNTWAREIGVKKPSCGALAVAWCREMKASSISVIGFGYKDGKWAKQKTYPDGTKDNNPEYDWATEQKWVEKNATLL